MSIPALGLGTFRLQDQQVIDSVRNGLELGYRHLDTAQIYGNEAEVGRAIAASGIPREDLFVTTKVWTEHLAANRLIPSLEESLASNLRAVDLRLSEAEMAAVATLDCGERLANPDFSPKWD